MRLPERMRWIFWDVDFDQVEVQEHADGILSRILERGRLEDVRWLIEVYGLDRIHTFFRKVWAPEITDRTRGFWRAVFAAKGEQWARPPAWRRSSSRHWVE